MTSTFGVIQHFKSAADIQCAARPRVKRESITRISVDGFATTWKKQLDVIDKTPLIDKLGPVLRSAADVRIQIDRDQFEAPLLLLQCYSKFFCTKTGKKIIELDATQINAEIFQKIAYWMMDPAKRVERETLIPLLKAAKYLQVDFLVGQIESVIADANRFQEHEALLLYLDAHAHNCRDIESLMIQRVQKFFLTFVACEEFVELSESQVENWLRLDSIGLNTEIEAFYVACRWLLHDWEGRKNLLNRLMKCVRFGLAEPWRIVELRMNRDHEKLNAILKNIELQETLELSLSYATYRGDFMEDSEQFAGFLERFNYEKLKPRIAMKDAIFVADFKGIRYSYADFEKYLKILRTNACSSWKNNVISGVETMKKIEEEQTGGNSQCSDDIDEILLKVTNLQS